MLESMMLSFRRPLRWLTNSADRIDTPHSGEQYEIINTAHRTADPPKSFPTRNSRWPRCGSAGSHRCGANWPQASVTEKNAATDTRLA